MIGLIQRPRVFDLSSPPIAQIRDQLQAALGQSRLRFDAARANLQRRLSAVGPGANAAPPPAKRDPATSRGTTADPFEIRQRFLASLTHYEPEQKHLGYTPGPKISGDVSGKPLGIPREYPQSFDRENKLPSENTRATRFQADAGPRPKAESGVWATGGIAQY